MPHPLPFDPAQFPVGHTPLSQLGTATPQFLMCPPTHYNVVYSINPWMQPEREHCDVELAKTQWQQLYCLLTDTLGVTVHVCDPLPHTPDMVFTANAAVVWGTQALIARFKYPQRQPEEPAFDHWFSQHGFDTQRLPDDLFLEGAGDALVFYPSTDDAHPDATPFFLAGYGTRSSSAGHGQLTALTGLPVVSLELAMAQYYHIDVCLCPLTSGYLLYSPAAFTADGLAQLHAVIPEAKRIAVTPEEGLAFACNAINIGPHVVMHEPTPGACDRLKNELAQRGFTLHTTPLSEFIKAGGSAKCLSLRVG